MDGSRPVVVEERRATVTLRRGEYANLYHTTAEWYNVYLLTQFFAALHLTQVHVLLIDAHPAGPFDQAWSRLFTGHESSTVYQGWNCRGLGVEPPSSCLQTIIFE